MASVILSLAAVRAYPARMDLPERLLGAVDSDPALPAAQREAVRTVVGQYRAAQQVADRYARRLRTWQAVLPAGAGAWEAAGRVSALWTVLETLAAPYAACNAKKPPVPR